MKRPLFLLLLLFGTMPLWAQRPYSVFHYTSREGLPQNSVRSLVFDQFGFLWMTTEAGIVRFDGNYFRTYGSKDFPAFDTDRFGQVLKTDDKTILFTDQFFGIHRLTGSSFQTIRSSSGTIPSLILIRGGIPNDKALSGVFSSLVNWSWPWRWSNLYLYVFPVDGNSHFIVKNKHTLEYHTRGRAFEYIDVSGFDPAEYFMINGRLMAFNQNKQLYGFDLFTKQFKRCSLKDETQGAWLKAPLKHYLFCSYPFEAAFLTHEKALYKITRNAGSDNYVISLVLNSLPDNCVINQIAYNPQNHLLAIGTDTEGLFLYKEQFFTSLIHESPEQGTNNAYYAQAELEHGVVLTAYGRLFATSGAKTGYLGQVPFSFYTNALLKDNSGALWYSQHDTLLALNTRSLQGTPSSFRSKNNVICFLEGKDKLWCGTRHGIGYVRGDSVEYVDRTVTKYRQNPPQEMCFDENGKIWYGVIGNLFRFDPQSGKVDSFALFKNKATRALHLIDDKMFVGTYGHGYYVFHQGHFTKMPTDRNGEMAHVHAFIPDANGMLWIPTNRGLYKTSLASLDAYLKDTTSNVYYYVYREEDGIRNAEFNGGCSPSFLNLSDGQVSLPSMGGLVLFRPEDVPNAIPCDSILVEAFQVDGKAMMDPGTELTVPANHKSVEVKLSTAWWQLESNLTLEYQLEGLDTSWLEVGSGQNRLIFGRLKPGSYTLALRKRCGFGPGDYTSTRMVFKVNYPWYLQWWSMLLFAGVLAGMLRLTILWNTRSVRQRNLMLQQKVDFQTQELKNANENLTINLHKLEASESDLKQTLNVKNRLIAIFSHDILTPLRFIGMIARFAIPAKTQNTVESNAVTALHDIRNASEKLFEHTQNILDWIKYQDKSIRPALANISPFAVAEQLLEDFSELAQYNGNKLVNAIPEDDVIRTDPKILTIILHNLLSNAIKFTQSGVITMGGCFSDGHYLLKVTDTGRGMTAEQMEQLRNDETVDLPPDAATATAGNSLGFVLIKELLEVLGGDWTIDGAVDKGVSVVVKLPVG